jgi:hypothetical protein
MPVMRPWQRSALNIALMQTAWFACVLGAARGNRLAGPVAVIVLTALHLRLLSRDPRREGLLIAGAALFGFMLETALGAAGSLRPNGDYLPFPLAPLWMTALWANFATLLDHSLRWLRKRPLLAALGGAVGGPAAYLGGERLGAVTIEGASGVLLLGAAWAVALPLLGKAAEWTLKNTSA